MISSQASLRKPFTKWHDDAISNREPFLWGNYIFLSIAKVNHNMNHTLGMIESITRLCKLSLHFLSMLFFLVRALAQPMCYAIKLLQWRLLLPKLHAYND